MHCHECGKGFIAAFDYSVNGNHVVLCPRCGHEHCRVIKDGEITGDRWDSREGRVDVPRTSAWLSPDGKGQTSTAALFIRDLWLNREDVQL